MRTKIFTLFIAAFILLPGPCGIAQTRNDSIISMAMSIISKDSIEEKVRWLQDMNTRFLMAENHRQVSESIKSRFESFGMSDVKLDSFECYTDINYGLLQYDTTTWQYNVEARFTGSLYPDEEIIVMGHHDNVQLDSNPELFAPGADDNASGTVAVLETARVLAEMGYQPEKTLIFLTTAAEELMNFGDAGSEHYASAAAAAGRNIFAVINNDMIGYDDGSKTIWLSNVVGSEEITGIATLVTEQYTSLTPNVNSPQYGTGADLQSFLDVGYPGLYLMEEVFNPYYHTDQDLIDHCDLDYMTEAIKISLGSLIYSDISVGITEDHLANMDISIFPNPCRDHIKFNLINNNDPFELRLLNSTGQLLQKISFSRPSGYITLSMDAYPAGVYILKAISGDRLASAKVVKKR